MPTFCLMHSSGQGPKGWRLLTAELAKLGHRTITPAFNLANAHESTAYHANTVLQALQASGESPANVVCVAHSAAGIYLPLVAATFRPRHMVFLAALVPQPGVSIRQQLTRDPDMLNPTWAGKNPNDDAVCLEYLFHDVPAERLEWALSTRVFFYAKNAIDEPCPLDTWPATPASYIACTADRTITPGWQIRTARERLKIEPILLQSGHCPNVSRPEALARILNTL